MAGETVLRAAHIVHSGRFMNPLERTVERRISVEPLRRTSWGAIAAGALVALALLSVLGVLGVAIGATTIDPATGDTPGLKSFGIGAGIWWLLSGLLSIFAGSWVAARLAGLSRRWEGPLHGIVTWSLVTMATFFLMTSLVGSLISGAFGVVKAGASAAGSGARALASAGIPGVDVSEELGKMDLPDGTFEAIQEEAKTLLRQSEKAALQPEALAEEADSLEGNVRATADLGSATGADNDIDVALANLRQAASTTVDAADKEAVVNILVARTEMSRDEAQRKVDKWSTDLQNLWASAKSKLGAAGDQIAETSAEVAEASAHAVAAAAWMAFFYLLLTAIAAGVGGMLGAPKQRVRIEPAVPARTV